MESSKKKRTLFDNDEETNDETTTKSLNINSSYAKEYESKKQYQELQNHRDLLLNSSSDDSDSDDDDVPLSDMNNQDFFHTMKLLRTKDESIYDSNVTFFRAANGNTNQSNSNGDKPKRIKDVLREQIIEQMNDDDADDSDKDQNKKDNDDEETPSRFQYDRQQKQLREEFLNATSTENHDDDDDDGSTDDLLVKKETTGTKATKVESVEIPNELKTSAPSSSFVDPRGEVQDGNQFLLNYLSKQKWKDDDDDDDDDINDGDGNGKANNEDAYDDNDHEDNDEKADAFEAKYNFRFEEAAAATGASGAAFSLQSYARGNQMNTLRRKDDTRKQKRESRKERKLAERKAKEEQLKRLKNAKKAEMNKKLAQVKSILGSSSSSGAADEVDEAAILKLLEGDFDPDKFEQAMKDAYDDAFYKKDDAEWKNDKDVRAAMLKDSEALESGVNQDTYDAADDGEVEEEYYDGGNDEGYGDEETDHADYAEYEEEEHEEEEAGTSALETKLKAKAQDELYKLDYEDIVAGMPTRFKYRKVEKNRYGLSAEEILLARDTTLKQFVSIKKMAPYRDDEFKVNSRKRRKFREMLDGDIKEQEQEEMVQRPTSETGKQDGEKDDDPAAAVSATDAEETAVAGKKKKRRRLKKGKKQGKTDAEAGNADATARQKDDEIADSTTATTTAIANSTATTTSTAGASDADSRGGGADKDAADDEAKGANANKQTDASNDSKKRKKKKKQKKQSRDGDNNTRKKKKSSSIPGMSSSRLSSYGLQ